MLEYFVCKHMSNKEEGFESTIMNDQISNLIVLIVAVAAAYLAYECNAHESAGTRIAITILAFLFSNIYIIYYFIRYVLVGDMCKGGRKGGKRSGKGRGKGKGRR